MLPELFFGYFAAVIVFLSVIVITRRNPVHSVMWMLLLFFHIAGLYLFLNAEFIAAIQIIVYAGAILVLFLFVLLLLNLREELRAKRFVGAWPAGLFVTSALLVIILSVLKSFVPGPAGKYSIEFIKQETHTKALGKLLYTDFLFPFEIASLVLLVAIIGAMVLAKRKTGK
ncbi:MAG: NADH-ubiquinone/plastoquinone oxidoreductase chain 6 [Nitrospiraceae bacterium]|nr:MAG: NADH-ubiquinone/plastoquinone oxidoreductase chain 6 [Nitrospiraceae bacterium]